MSPTEEPTLVFHSAYRPFFISDSVIALSSKFEEVLHTWGELWPGKVVYLAERSARRTVDMSLERRLDQLPMATQVVDRSRMSSDLFPKNAIVLAALNGGIPRLGDYVSEPAAKLVSRGLCTEGTLQDWRGQCCICAGWNASTLPP